MKTTNLTLERDGKEMKNLLSFVLILLSVALIPSRGNATSITGIAVDPGDVGTEVGTVTDSGIKYFIPLHDDQNGVYGVDDYGLFSDTDPAPLGDSVLDMYIYFDIPEGEIGDTLTLWFDDLDLMYYNDPTGFYETLALDVLDDSITYTTWADLDGLDNVSLGVGDDDNYVSITISDLELNDDFLLNLSFTSYSVDLSGTYYNTPEYLTATLDTATTPVPEPSTYLLFGTGMLGLVWYRRRQGLKQS